MKRKLISLLLCAAALFALGGTALAETQWDIPEEKDPSEYEYPVPEGLPVVDITSWEYRLANQNNGIGPYCCPQVGFVYEQGIDLRIYDNVIAMIEACRSEGLPCYINCGYRDYSFCFAQDQTALAYYYSSAAEMAANRLCTGCNEHQTGLGLDITDSFAYSANYDGQINEDAVYSETWAWMKEHCAEYGFIVRYPEGKEEYYGLACHPTHLRYVGTEAAQYITENNLCLEEFLLLYGYPVKLPAD